MTVMRNRSKPCRIVHVVPAMFGFDGVYGGAERYALELARAMAERVPTTLVAFGSRPWEGSCGRLRVRVLRNWVHFRRFRFDPINPALLGELASAEVIHYHQTHTMMASLALLFARACRKPIFTSHLGGGGYGLHRFMNVTDWYKGHLHISDFSRRIFGHELNPRAEVIWGGVDTNLFCPDATVPRTGEVVYAGRLLPHKGINYLVEAVDADTPLVIAGRPWRHAQRFLELLHELARGKKVFFRQDCDDSGLISYYRRALCVVLPSVYATVYGEKHTIPELLGQTLLEGMACGTPAICTSVGAMPEIVEDGITGFVVPPNDPEALGEKIRWLRTHPVEAQRMGEAARERVLERFTWWAVVERCLRAYAVLSQNKSSSSGNRSQISQSAHSVPPLNYSASSSTTTRIATTL
jgi:glycosyltransferase involved in cell wall biosynthesis